MKSKLRQKPTPKSPEPIRHLQDHRLGSFFGVTQVVTLCGKQVQRESFELTLYSDRSTCETCRAIAAYVERTPPPPSRRHQ